MFNLIQKWNFPSNNYGQIFGIADSGVETFKGTPIKSLAREICQNSLDAALDDLKGFTSPDFHEDYQGIAFDIEAGCVMAVGKMVTVDISKDIDDLANTPSIFNISKNPDESCKQMLVDMSQRKIIIKLPLSDFYSYKALSTTPLAQPILNSLTVVPALVYVLEELRALPIQERSENSDTLWYKVLSKALLTQFDCDIESEEFSNQNCLVLAQKLINNPVSDAFTFLTSSFGAAGGDE